MCESHSAVGRCSAVWLGGYAPQYWCSEARDRRGPLAETLRVSPRRGRGPGRRRGSVVPNNCERIAPFKYCCCSTNFFCSNHSAGEKSTQNASPSLWVSFWRSLFSQSCGPRRQKENPPSCACENPPNSPFMRRHFIAAFSWGEQWTDQCSATGFFTVKSSSVFVKKKYPK